MGRGDLRRPTQEKENEAERTKSVREREAKGREAKSERARARAWRNRVTDGGNFAVSIPTDQAQGDHRGYRLMLILDHKLLFLL